jgi:hypothetical protein
MGSTSKHSSEAPAERFEGDPMGPSTDYLTMTFAVADLPALPLTTNVAL